MSMPPKSIEKQTQYVFHIQCLLNVEILQNTCYMWKNAIRMHDDVKRVLHLIECEQIAEVLAK